MDALSFALARIRLRSPLIARMYLGQNVAIDMRNTEPPSGVCPFHYVIEGSALLVSPSGMFPLECGDLVFLPRWPDYRLENGSSPAALDIRELAAAHLTTPWSPKDGLDQSLVLKAGSPPFPVNMLGGICLFEQQSGASILDGLPDIIVTRAAGNGTEDLLRAVLSFVENESSQRPGYAATAARLLEALLVESLRTWILGNALAPGRLRGLNDPQLAVLIHRLHVQPGLDWTLPEMARIAGQSRSKFAEHFKETIGKSPAAFVRQLRCEIAAQRLNEGDAVAALAHDLGYSSSFAFTRAFQSETGTSPARFRREALSKRRLPNNPA